MTDAKKAEINARVDRVFQRRDLVNAAEVYVAKAIAAYNALLQMDRDDVRAAESVGRRETEIAKSILLSKAIGQRLNEAHALSYYGWDAKSRPSDEEIAKCAADVWKSGGVGA